MVQVPASISRRTEKVVSRATCPTARSRADLVYRSFLGHWVVYRDALRSLPEAKADGAPPPTEALLSLTTKTDLRGMKSAEVCFIAASLGWSGGGSR